MSLNAPVDFGVYRKNAAATIVETFDFFDEIATFWDAGKEFATNAYCRPTSPTGFSYQATVGGQAGGVEPVWPTTVDETVFDGQITWTAKAAGANGVDGLTWPSPEPAAIITPVGPTISAQAIVNGKATNSAIQLTITGGTAGTKYTISIEVTSGSQTLIGVFTLLVL